MPAPRAGIIRVVVVVAALAVALPQTSSAVSSTADRIFRGAEPPLQRTDHLTSVIATLPAPPRPVRAADHHVHLAYELMLTNANPIGVAVTRIDTVNARTHRRLGTLSGSELRGSMAAFSGTAGNKLGAGVGGFVVLDLRLPRGARPPVALRHRLTVQPLPAGSGPGVHIVTGHTRVGTDQPVVVSPPVRGNRWVDVGGCCAPGAHRTALLPVNGSLHLSQRFAVDLVHLTRRHLLVTGPLDRLRSYPSYGVPVRSATSGLVVMAVDGRPDQVPFAPEGVTIPNAGGNNIGIRTGDGSFVWYAHLKPGSVRVAEGDVVHRGQVIARLGNSGNTDLPHLHFQVCDAPALLGSEGLPWVLRRYRSPGVTPPVETIDPTAAIPFLDRLRGLHRNEMPLEPQVLSFGHVRAPRR
jgi:hypothetical protein